MIITRYLQKEILKSQVAILCVLFAIFFGQKLIRILSSTGDGNLPIHLLLSLLVLGIPQMLDFILPLCLFLAILMAYSRLYLESEMISLQACGIKKQVLLYPVVTLSLLTMLLACMNNIWFKPYSAQYQNHLIANAKANPSLAGFNEGQFKTFHNGNDVIYIGQINKDHIGNIFIVQLKNGAIPNLILANQGEIKQDSQGNQYLQLDKATRYEGSATQQNFRISQLTNYEAVILHRTGSPTASSIEQLSITQLWKSNDVRALYELTWRATLVICIPLLALIAVPLSEVNPRQGRVLSVLPAILLYLIYFLLQNALKSNGEERATHSLSLMWLVNFVYLLLAVLLNSWDSVTLRRLRTYFKRERAHV